MGGQTKQELDNIASGIELAKDWRLRHGAAKKVTINDVAQIAGVSKKTISRIINKAPNVADPTRAHVQAIIDVLGYVPDPQARGLAFRHSFLIGMIYDNPNAQYIVNMQQGILDVLGGTDYELVVHPCDRSHPDFLSRARAFIERQKLYGVILTPSVSEDENLAEVLRGIGCKYVRLASIKLDADEHMIVSNDRQGAKLAALHLCEFGHRRIAMIEGRAGFKSSGERRAGFEAGLAEHGLKLQPEYIAKGEYTFESGVQAGKDLLAKTPRPTAIFCANDEMAAGVLQALRISGLRAPDNVSVVGFDDFQIATNVWPRLTSIHSPTRDFAQQAARRLLSVQAQEGSSPAGPVTPWLVKRDSSGPPPS